MEDLYKQAAENVQKYQASHVKRPNEEKDPSKLEAAKEHFMQLITEDVEDKIRKASSSGKTKILLMRMNFRYDNKPNWPEYYSNDFNVKDLLQHPEYGLLDDLRARFNTVKDGEEGFKLELLNTSHSVWCLFLYWCSSWEDCNDERPPLRRRRHRYRRRSGDRHQPDDQHNESK